jgi:hypothetical protein
MSSRRNTGRLTVINGLTAAIVLSLVGLAAARADELADLRADQQLLQQRLDQLHPPPAQGAAPGSGVSSARTAPDRPPVSGGSFPRSFLIPGTNTSVTIGGSVQQNFGYVISR